MYAFRRLREQEAEARVLAALAPIAPVNVAESDEPKRRRVSRRSEATATEN
jgi:hypothetical protein